MLRGLEYPLKVIGLLKQVPQVATKIDRMEFPEIKIQREIVVNDDQKNAKGSRTDARR